MRTGGAGPSKYDHVRVAQFGPTRAQVPWRIASDATAVLHA